MTRAVESSCPARRGKRQKGKKRHGRGVLGMRQEQWEAQEESSNLCNAHNVKMVKMQLEHK
jgi:hypothetical protein